MGARRLLTYSKTCLKRSLKNRHNKGLNGKWLLNEGPKYFWPALRDTWSWKPICGIFAFDRFKQGLLVAISADKADVKLYHNTIAFIRPYFKQTVARSCQLIHLCALNKRWVVNASGYRDKRHTWTLSLPNVTVVEFTVLCKMRLQSKFKGTVDSCLFLTVIRDANLSSLF